MKIYITGGAGCLGSNIIERYLPIGHEFFVLDNFATGKKEVVPEVKGLQVVEGSIEDYNLLSDTFKAFGPDLIIHSAASYKDPNNYLEDANTNIIGSINLVNAAKDNGVNRIINFQTALCYGRPSEVPIPISHPTRPFTSYGISKTAGEAYLINSGLNVVSLRLSNICGPRLAIGPIPTFYQRIQQGKSCFCSDSVRDFLDMEDFFSLLDILLFEADVKSGFYNVSTGVGKSIFELYKVVAQYLGSDNFDVPIVPVGEDDVPAVVLDPSLTESTFNWKAKIDFETTIINQLKWYDKYGVNDIYSHLAEPKSE